MVFVHDLLFHLHNTNSFKIIENEINKINFLICTGLPHSAPKHLKKVMFNQHFSVHLLLKIMSLM